MSASPLSARHIGNPGDFVGLGQLHAAVTSDTITLTFLSGGTVDIDPGKSLLDGVYRLTINGVHVASKVAPPATSGTLEVNGDGIGDINDIYTLTGEESNDLFRLFGDINGDGQVTSSDFNAFRAAYESVLGDANYNFAFDYNGDGAITSYDYNQFRIRYGVDLFL